jgi:hypothetical protein
MTLLLRLIVLFLYLPFFKGGVVSIVFLSHCTKARRERVKIPREAIGCSQRSRFTMLGIYDSQPRIRASTGLENWGIDWQGGSGLRVEHSGISSWYWLRRGRGLHVGDYPL